MKLIKWTLISILFILVVCAFYAGCTLLSGDEIFHGAEERKFQNITSIYKGLNLNEGIDLIENDVKKWREDCFLGKIIVWFEIDFNKNVYRNVIRYLYQSGGNYKNNIPCENQKFDLKEYIYSPELTKLYHKNSWHTKACYSSGTSPEICLRKLLPIDVTKSFYNAVDTIYSYLAPIINEDSTIFIRYAQLHSSLSNSEDEWEFQIVNSRWNTEKNFIQISATIGSKDNQIWAVFINGSPEYVDKWKNLEYLNPNRPIIHNN